MGKTRTIVGATATLLALVLGACATPAGNGGGGVYVPQSNADIGNTVATDVQGPGTPDIGVTQVGVPAEELAVVSQFGLPAMAAASAFANTGIDGKWFVTFSNWSAYATATATIAGRVARLDLPQKFIDDSNSTYPNCKVQFNESVYVEVAASGDLAVGWHAADYTKIGCGPVQVNGKISLPWFVLRRHAGGSGQFASLAGEWDVLYGHAGSPANLGCRIRIGPQGLEGCLNALNVPVTGSLAATTLSGHFRSGSSTIEYAANKIEAVTSQPTIGKEALVAQAYSPGTFQGGWTASLANWAAATTADVQVGGRTIFVKLPSQTEYNYCTDKYDTTIVQSWLVESAASGEMAVVWGRKTSTAAPGSDPWCGQSGDTLSPQAVLRRTASGTGQFGQLAGKYEMTAFQGGRVTAVSIDSAGLLATVDGQFEAMAKQDGPTVSGKFAGNAEFTAFRK